MFWPRSCCLAEASRLQPDHPRDALYRVVWALSLTEQNPVPYPGQRRIGGTLQPLWGSCLQAGLGENRAGVGRTGNIFCNLLE